MTNYSERQIQIFNAAIELIGKGGIQNLTTRNLAKLINVTEPIIYKHFKNKVEVVQLLLVYLKERVIESMELICQKPIPPDEKIKILIKQLVRNFSNRPEIVTVILSEGLYQNYKELSDIIYAIMQETASYYNKIICEGQKAGIYRNDIDCKELAFITLASLRLNVIQWHLSGHAFSLKEQGEKVYSTIDKLIRK